MKDLTTSTAATANQTIFDKILHKKVWTCFSTSIKAQQDPERDCCYPRVGVTYNLVESPARNAPRVGKVGAEEMYVWRRSTRTVDTVMTAERELKTLKFTIDESALPEDHLPVEHPDKFPKQDLMLKEFVDAFNSVRFREVADNMMISTPACISSKKIQNGKQMAIVFIATLVESPNGEAIRMTQLWSDDYLGTPPIC